MLTKPLGTGIISTAGKAEMADAGTMEKAVASMIRLNDAAAEVMAESAVNACTDITGFGLMGHGAEMARGSGVSFRLFFSRIPVLEGAGDYAAQGLIPGGAYCNEKFLERETFISPEVPHLEKIILFDPQTSGGLLISVPEAELENVLKKLQEKGIKEAAAIGEVVPKGEHLIRVEK